MRYTDPTTGEAIAGIPRCNTDDPAELEAWFGEFGFADHFRKCVLASCKEAERAKATDKISETRLDDLARVSDTYVQFLVDSLHGRTLREENARASVGMGAP